CFVLVVIPISFVQAKDTITWPYFHYPPLFVSEKGQNEVTGYGIDVTNHIMQRLSRYNHRFVLSPPARLFSNFKKGEKQCLWGLLKNPKREKFLHFSIPAFITLPRFIVIKRKDLEKFGGGKPVSLRNLLKNKKLILVIKTDVVYSIKLNQILDEFKGQENIHVAYTSEYGRQELRMLEAGHVDYTISNSSTPYELHKLGLTNKLMLIPQTDDQSYNLVHVGCSKTDWGKQVIDNINKVLQKEISTEIYFNFYKVLVTENYLPEYRRVFQELIVKPLNKEKN
ncbi:MAG: transporter substrate-binding domain-containing protein, partial [Deltaproteobacteria bacterium]|nr:transporter substrate-binding domain-containing protein [Deltaproteobacteria bacterium]